MTNLATRALAALFATSYPNHPPYEERPPAASYTHPALADVPFEALIRSIT